ncbi:MAG TPA: DUF4157 domain-containing protein [Longimicrobium sp.]|nr:DUF4157 domain-containing protein [Longimicrobium sp.]
MRSRDNQGTSTVRERLMRPDTGPREGARNAAAAPVAVPAVAGPGLEPLRAPDHPPPFPVRPAELRAALGPGEPLPAAAEGALQRTLGHDFSRVRVHTGARGDHVARSLGADALAFGDHMVFRGGRYAPGTSTGDALLRHEGIHLAAGTARGGTRSAAPVQLAVGVDDVTEEMVGMPFVLRTAQGTAPDQIPAGATVTVTAWPVGFAATVSYKTPKATITLSVPKLALTPAPTAVAGVRQYNVGLSGQQSAVETRQKSTGDAWGELASWRATKDQYKKNPKVWEEGVERLEKEVARQEGLLVKSQTTLSRMLVRETMYNRFDGIIKQWVDHYNAQFKPATDLDPNLVKSMLFQESRLGTEGTHLEKPPYSWTDSQKHPVRSRYNLGQAVDSYAHQQMLMIEEMAPDLYTKHKLADLAKEDRKKGKTEGEMYSWNGGKLSTAMQEFFTRRDAGDKNPMGTAGRDLHEDYAFWIRTAIRWLFYKYKSLAKPTWAEAIRAYNGDGPDARTYRDAVVGRTAGKGAINVGNK